MKFKKIYFIILMLLTATAVSAGENTGINLTLSYNRENNTTIVMVTHEPDFAKRSARNIHLVDGVIESDTKKKTR